MELLKAELLKSDTLLKTYTGEKLQVLGQLQVLVRHSGQQQLPLPVVTEKRGGGNWLAAIQLNWAHNKQVRTGLDTSTAMSSGQNWVHSRDSR